MPRPARIFSFLYIICALSAEPSHAKLPTCRELLTTTGTLARVERIKAKVVDKILDAMAALRGLPKYQALIKEAERTDSYLSYQNFGEMGLAEMGIRVRYRRESFKALRTDRPLIIVANHHLGIADGLALQYLTARARPHAPALLFLARWIEKLLPFAVFGDRHGWGTAVPVEINTPAPGDPEFDRKMAEAKDFNTSWNRKAARVLRGGGTLIVFPAGHVASINAGKAYPEGVHDAVDSWKGEFLKLARLGKADIVFANVDSVNSEAFYRKRKRFGGRDKERVIWFLGEALAKRNTAVDVHFTRPMALGEVYEMLSAKHGYAREMLETDHNRTAELMRQYTYELNAETTGALDTIDSPARPASLTSTR